MLSSQGCISSAASTVSVSAMEMDRKPRTSGHLLRIEPQSVEWMRKIPLAVEKLKEAGWFSMFERIREYHIGITRSFCQIFDGSIVNIGGLEFEVMEEAIVQDIGVIPKGKKWYKRQSINEDYNQFLLPSHKNPD